MGFLEFKEISKSFPGVKALDNVSFRAESGKSPGADGRERCRKEYTAQDHER